MKRLVSTAATAALCFAALPVAAAIAPHSTGNSELTFHVVDATAKVSYVLDLGIYMGLDLGVGTATLAPGVTGTGSAADFIVIAQQDIGYQRFWVLGDIPNSVWNTFLTLTDPSRLQWAVLAGDSTGGNNAGANRMLTTVRQGQESKLSTFTNTNLSTAVGSTQGNQFYGTVNAIATASGKGSHAPQTDYTINGDSYSLSSDAGNGYYGKVATLGPTLNGFAPFDNTNPVGSSSWFYYLQRSSSSAGGFVSIDEVDNLGADGYWGFVKVQGSDPLAVGYDPTSPYLGKYLLSFTLPAYDVRTTASFRTFAQGIDRTEFSGGMQVTALDGVAAAGTQEAAAGWVTRLGAAAAGGQGLPTLLQLTSPVPEPTTWALWLAGLAVVSRGLARRRSR